jgi:aminoglycoside phosphotransferase family enzyme
MAFLEQSPTLLDSRVCDGRIIEAHGDLRPEHICLEDEPVIIDCLEFNQALRVLDTVSELAFLALVWHLKEPEVRDTAQWRHKAQHYLHLASRHTRMMGHG